MKVIYANEAKKDLKNLYDYIVKNSTHATANKVVDLIIKDVLLLEQMPRIGTKLKGENIRFLVVKKYVVVYEIREEIILIANIYSKGQNWR